MALLPAKRDGCRYINSVPTKVDGLSLIVKMGVHFFKAYKQPSSLANLSQIRLSPPGTREDSDQILGQGTSLDSLITAHETTQTK